MINTTISTHAETATALAQSIAKHAALDVLFELDYRVLREAIVLAALDHYEEIKPFMLDDGMSDEEAEATGEAAQAFADLVDTEFVYQIEDAISECVREQLYCAVTGELTGILRRECDQFEWLRLADMKAEASRDDFAAALPDYLKPEDAELLTAAFDAAVSAQVAARRNALL